MYFSTIKIQQRRGDDMRLWTWLKSWFVQEDLYKPKERLIYRYWDGFRLIHADPVVLYKRMAEKGPELAADVSLARSISKNAAKGQEMMIEKIKYIFNIPDSDPFALEKGGLNQVEILQVLYDFLVWNSRLKKNSRNPQTSAGGTLPITESLSDEGQSIQNGMDCGSIDAGSTSDVQQPLPTVAP